MLKVGITGQSGFVGWHLYHTLSLEENIELVPFQKEFFSQQDDLRLFVSKCDVIVHLAAMNRHPDPEVIYNTNIDLVKSLIDACKAVESTPHILFSSSTQEERDNHYGESKKIGRELLTNWAETQGARFTSLTIPNVFGPFGKPEYNSVVATFCHKIARQETPKIIKDGEIGLIYINRLVDRIITAIIGEREGEKLGSGSIKIDIPPQYFIKVSELLNTLQNFRSRYMEAGVFPDLTDPFKLDLFNTFRCYIPADHYPVLYTQHTDNRGSFVEIARTETSGQFSFSTTVPGITRGNHFHTRKAERFAVIKGKATIALRKKGTDEVITYHLDGSNPAYVDMPIWYTHNITNVGDEELVTLFWINEPFDPEDADTYFEEV